MKKLLGIIFLLIGVSATAAPREFNACLQYKIGKDEWSKPLYKQVTIGTGEEIDELTGCEKAFGCYDDIFSDYILISPWPKGDYTVLRVGNALLFEPRNGSYSDQMKGDDNKTWRIAEQNGSATSCPRE